MTISQTASFSLTAAIRRADALTKTGLVLFGSALLAASAWVEVPMFPVPMTMQTLAVLIVGALYGPRLGCVTGIAYLAQGALGLPVFAGGAAGLAHLAGPTAGYLLGFPLAMAFTGWCVHHGYARRLILAFAVMLAAHVLIFALGVGWLATLIGLNAAITAGFIPFIAGTLVKAALAVALVKAAR